MSQRTILDIPQIPQEIIDAVNDDELAIFFGAGTSMSIGCSSWEKTCRDSHRQVFSRRKKGRLAKYIQKYN